MKVVHAIDWALRIVAAVILLQTLYFKFTGADESRYIFSSLGAEPWGRIASGVVELIAAVLLLVPRTAVFGAALAVLLMCGALSAHVTRLGIAVQGDGGLLFSLAAFVLVSACSVLWIHRGELANVWRETATSHHH